MSLKSDGQVHTKSGRKTFNPRDAFDAAGELCVSKCVSYDVFSMTVQSTYDLKCSFTVSHNYLVCYGNKDSMNHTLYLPCP